MALGTSSIHGLRPRELRQPLALEARRRQRAAVHEADHSIVVQHDRRVVGQGHRRRRGQHQLVDLPPPDRGEHPVEGVPIREQPVRVLMHRQPGRVDLDFDVEGGLAALRGAKDQSPPVPTVELTANPKLYEYARAAGADEIDMVINVGALKSGRDDLVYRDIRAVVEAAQDGKAPVQRLADLPGIA